MGEWIEVTFKLEGPAAQPNNQQHKAQVDEGAQPGDVKELREEGRQVTREATWGLHCFQEKLTVEHEKIQVLYFPKECAAQPQCLYQGEQDEQGKQGEGDPGHGNAGAFFRWLGMLPCRFGWGLWLFHGRLRRLTVPTLCVVLDVVPWPCEC